MRLLVTGGAGFIGSNFVRYVLETTTDVQVTNLDALTYAGNPASLRDVEGYARHRFVHADIRDTEGVDREAGNADAVVHFAAESHVDRSIVRPRAFFEPNVVAGVVFDACRRYDVESALLISTTDEVYGSIDEPHSFTESDPLVLNSSCSASKAVADLLPRSYRTTYGFPATVTCTANNYGPCNHPEKVIPLFVTSLIDGAEMPRYGDGNNVRDWTHVRDKLGAQWLILNEGVPAEIYNVRAGNEIPNKELTFAILEQFGFAEEYIQHVTDRPGPDLRYSIDTAKIWALGWQPQIAFEDGLAARVAWYRDNEWWWRPLKEARATDRRGIAR